ncbi:MAG: DUF370 domain-containing protein [Desulfamplus sp.]|nr:DUF370 domain-containing protein [Desulfamplus sp.]MBF0241112.1 DUF370 domain-containing protein [Desulfamplus sp.]MBF0388887.1 DUF370 domain-containing protein [Desulfamplus sp.]
MEQELLNIGFGNTIVADKVVTILTPNTSPMKRLKDEAKEDKRLIDATHGRKTRSIIVTESNHVILSAIQAETISQRYTSLKKGETVKDNQLNQLEEEEDES